MNVVQIIPVSAPSWKILSRALEIDVFPGSSLVQLHFLSWIYENSTRDVDDSPCMAKLLTFTIDLGDLFVIIVFCITTCGPQ
jgi:hypothetical protein